MSESNVVAFRRPPTVGANTLTGEPPQRLWHVRDWIPGNTVTLLTGDGGVGKSTLALQLAVATAIGKPWLGQAPVAGKVLYFSAEDDLGELHRRLDEISIGLAVKPADLDLLTLWPLAEEDAVLALETRSGQIEPTELWAELFELAVEAKPALIVLDSLADVFGGNENVRAQVRQFVGLLRRLAIATGGAVVVLAHPSLAGMQSGTGSSGSTAWHNSVRSRLYFTRPSEPDSDPDARLLSLRKANYTAPQADMRLHRAAGGFVLESGGGSASRLDIAIEHRRIDAIFLQLLDAYTAQRRHVGDKPGASFAPTRFAEDALAKGCRRAGLVAAMNRLLHAGEIRVEMIGRASRQVRALVRTSSAGGQNDG